MSGGGTHSLTPWFRAFTLAEILITLGIIGVVASLTMPSLIQHHKKAEATTRLKKFYSAMSQAILLSEIDNGPALDWQYPSYTDSNGEDISAEDNKNFSLAYFNKYLAKYLKYMNVDENSSYTESDNIARYIKVTLADSSYFYMKVGACMDLRFDVNGDKSPNKDGRDIYTFIICSGGSNADYHCAGKPFCPYGYGVFYNDRTAAKNNCAEGAGDTCANLLLIDNWEFKDDYPFKL